MEEASYKKYGGFDGVQEARRQQLDAQAATRVKRKAAEAKKVAPLSPARAYFLASYEQRVVVFACGMQAFRH